MIRRLETGWLKTLSGLALISILAGACSSSDDDSSSSSRASAKCERFLTEVCDLALSCGETESESSCMAEVREVITCGDVVSVTSSYEQCIADIPSHSCGDGIPDSCTGVLETLSDDEQSADSEQWQ